MTEVRWRHTGGPVDALELAGAEVLTWDADRLPKAVSETMGPLVVYRGGVEEGQDRSAVAAYGWWCHPILRQGDLLIRDPARDRIIGEHPKGTWNMCINVPDFGGLG